MGWVKLDDGFFLNPKVMALSPSARLFHIAAICWAGSANTDGYVPNRALATLAVQTSCSKRAQVVRELCSEGLWLEADGGHVIHDYLQWQQSAEERAHQRERNRAKAERRREREASNPASNPVTNPASNRQVTEPEADTDTEKTNNRAAGADTAGLEREFEAWYRAYPRKRERSAALAKYKARRRGGVSAEDLLTAALRYADHGRRTGRTPAVTKHPATFLNNGWEDWLPGAAADQEQAATNGQRNLWEVKVIEP